MAMNTEFSSLFVKIAALNVILYVLHYQSIASVTGNSNLASYMKKEHTLIRPYQGSGMMIPNWDFVGSTIVTSNYIRLTPDQQSKQGALWNNVPCLFPYWEVVVHFKAHGSGKDLYGDGLAIWYVKEPLQVGPVFGSKDLFSGLGVFLDTYANQNGQHNHGHPYLSAMVNNGTQHYDHDRDGTHTELAGCEAKIRGVEHDTFINVRYLGDTVTVFTGLDGKNEWKECFQVKGVQLPTGYYFGISAATGDLADNHDVMFIKVFELELNGATYEDRSNIVPSADHFAAPREHVDDLPQSTSGTRIFTVVLCIIVAIVICAVGAVIYFQRQETSRKRLY